MTESTATNGTVFYDHRLSNGLRPILNRLLFHITCVLVRVMNPIPVSRASPTFSSTWFLRVQKRLTGKR